MPAVTINQSTCGANCEGRRVHHLDMSAWSSWLAEHPLRAAGTVLVVETTALIGLVGHAVAETLALAVRYHVRRLLGVPDDWPPAQ